jgi:hypothetical protein
MLIEEIALSAVGARSFGRAIGSRLYHGVQMQLKALVGSRVGKPVQGQCPPLGETRAKRLSIETELSSGVDTSRNAGASRSAVGQLD